MGEVVQFVPRHTATRKPMVEQTLEQQAVEIIGGLSLDCDPETLLEFAASGGPVYVAPERDGA